MGLPHSIRNQLRPTKERTKEYIERLSSKNQTLAYIKKRISNPSRIYGKGYGESQLVNDCGCEGSVVSDCSEEEHQANRRTEFKIISVTPEPPPQEIDETKYLNGEVYEKNVFSRDFFEGCDYSEPLDN